MSAIFERHTKVCMGGKISVHRFEGGAKTRRAIIEGGQVLSASDFRNSTAPPAVNNDHSLSRLLKEILATCYMKLSGATVV